MIVLVLKLEPSFPRELRKSRSLGSSIRSVDIVRLMMWVGESSELRGVQKPVESSSTKRNDRECKSVWNTIQ